jgi:uncharacterized protein (DUF2235 family)
LFNWKALMGKTIVICADGTGNTFTENVSNVSHLMKLLRLESEAEQIAFYDQGIGTDPNLVRSIKDYAAMLKERGQGLQVLEEPRKPVWMPEIIARGLGLAIGYGLKNNVKQMYRVLCKHWCVGDRVFLFGFSRGAFTARALAGLVYRCGLLRPHLTTANRFEACFAKAYALYQPHYENTDAVKKFRADFGVPDECEIQFLGIWDTVKSYGGVWPQSLPHLRHNPIVRIVRHALALHEKRSWFIPTSWGNIDGDDLVRLGVKPDPRYEEQDVQEVWFCGCHSDVGGGDIEQITAAIPLRWMLREANACGLKLNDDGKNVLDRDDPTEPPEIHESLKCGWLLTEYIPRFELDNSRRPPTRLFKIGRGGQRHVEQFARGGKVSVHKTAQRSYAVKTVVII